MTVGRRIEHCYVHVPFCPTICPFCSFEVRERRAGAVDAYLTRLDDEAARTNDRVDVGPLRTLYLGGGTPSYLRSHEFERLVEVLRRRVGWAPEVTLEVHPSTCSQRRFSRWRELGITRFSVGVQSFDDEVLSRLGRHHDAASGRQAVEWAVDTGAEVSLDLIVAVEGQDVAADIDAAVASGVEHVSAYTLTVEDGTPFALGGVEVDATAEHDAIMCAGTTLGGSGLERYEVSNHARRGHECRHNQAYWDGRWWLGLGPGASAHEPPPCAGAAAALRRTNPPFERWLAGEEADPELLTPVEVGAELVIAGLRRVKGVDLDEVDRRTGVSGRWQEAIDDLVAIGHLVVQGNRVAATPAGLLHLDAVSARFV